METAIHRRTVSRARCLVALGTGLVLVGAARAEITLEEAVTVFDGDLATATMPQIQGGTDQTYVLVIATELNDDVTGVIDTLAELSWSERKEQCGVGEGTGVRLWTAQGSPSGPFQVQITHAAAGMDLTAVLARYSGVSTIEDATGENTNGENDATCSGTAKTTTAQLTLTSSQNQSVHVIGVCPVQSFVNTFSAGYALIDKGQQGKAYTFVYEGAFDTAATDTFQATVNGAAVKWSTAGIVLNPVPTTYYRSIGTDTGILAQTGTATTTTGSSVVNFSDTLPTDIGPGDKLTVGTGGPATMFSDAFTDGAILGWTHAAGEDTLSESSGALRATGATTDSHYTVDTGSGWTDYTVTCDIKAHDDDFTGISFRAQDGNNYYRFAQNFGNAGQGQWELSLEKVVAGTPTDLATPIDHDGLVSEEVWYTLKVEVSGTSIKCYFDDVLKFDVTDSTYSHDGHRPGNRRRSPHRRDIQDRARLQHLAGVGGRSAGRPGHRSPARGGRLLQRRGVYESPHDQWLHHGRNPLHDADGGGGPAAQRCRRCRRPPRRGRRVLGEARQRQGPVHAHRVAGDHQLARRPFGRLLRREPRRGQRGQLQRVQPADAQLLHRDVRFGNPSAMQQRDDAEHDHLRRGG
jgi:hypothetical protein